MPTDHAVLIVGLRDRPSSWLIERLALGRSILEEGSAVIRVARIPLEMAADALNDALRSEAIFGAALVKEAWLPERSWMAIEWRGALVVDRDLDYEVPEGWDADHGHPDVVVLRPRDAAVDEVVDPGVVAPMLVESPGEFRAARTDRRPVAVHASIRSILHDPRSWFGEFSDSRLGGAIGLLALSGARPDGTSVRLRNPAALGLEITDGPSRIAWASATGKIAVRGWGLTWTTARELDLPTRLARDAFTVTLDQSRGAASSYGIYLEIEGLSDPELELDDGTVLEQEGVNGVQTLATAEQRFVSVDVGELKPLAAPAWCLNISLRAPNGEPVRPTPLRLDRRLNSQAAAWEDRRRYDAA